MNDNLFCSFCGKNQKEVQKLIAGPAVYICDECIQLCSEIIEEERGKDEKDTERLLVPKEIKEMLDDYVIEQDAAKKILAVCSLQSLQTLGLYNQNRRCGDPEEQYSSYRTDRVWKNIAGTNSCQIFKCTLYHCRCYQPY